MSGHTTTAIEKLRIYQTSRQLEDDVYELVKALPAEEFYGLGDQLRRTSAAISHYLHEGHRRYSYQLKLEALHLARTEADHLKDQLLTYQQHGFGDTTSLQSACTAITKQAWGLIKYLKRRQSERQSAVRINAADALVAARR
jgi:four helix bundle protein